MSETLLDSLIKLLLCVSGVYVLVWLAGLYDDFMRWRTKRSLLKTYRKRWDSR